MAIRIAFFLIFDDCQDIKCGSYMIGVKWSLSLETSRSYDTMFCKDHFNCYSIWAMGTWESQPQEASKCWRVSIFIGTWQIRISLIILPPWLYRPGQFLLRNGFGLIITLSTRCLHVCSESLIKWKSGRYSIRDTCRRHRESCMHDSMEQWIFSATMWKVRPCPPCSASKVLGFAVKSFH